MRRAGVVQRSQKNGVLREGQWFTNKLGDRRRGRRWRLRFGLLAGHRVIAAGQHEDSRRCNSRPANHGPRFHGFRPSLRRAILLRRILRNMQLRARSGFLPTRRRVVHPFSEVTGILRTTCVRVNGLAVPAIGIHGTSSTIPIPRPNSVQFSGYAPGHFPSHTPSHTPSH